MRIAPFTTLPRRLLIAPRLRSLGWGEDGRSAVAIDGLVCSVCASRTKAALESVPGVREVEVDLRDGRALLRHDREVDPAALARALDSVVVLPRARRLIERIARSARSAHEGRAA